MLAALHMLFAGAWIGTVLVEALFERALLGLGRDKELILARLHWKVDKLVELPLLLATVISGARLLRNVPLDGLLRGKLACAALAMFAGWRSKRSRCRRTAKASSRPGSCVRCSVFARVSGSMLF